MSDLLEARAAITDLVHTYAKHVRDGSGVECVELFTVDAIFEVREALIVSPGTARTRSKLTGREAISSYLARTAAPETRVCPLIHNLLIDVHGHEATSTCVLNSLVWSTGQQIIGEYQDTFRFDTRWRFTSRVFTIMAELPSQSVPSAMRPA